MNLSEYTIFQFVIEIVAFFLFFIFLKNNFGTSPFWFRFLAAYGAGALVGSTYFSFMLVMRKLFYG